MQIVSRSDPSHVIGAIDTCDTEVVQCAFADLAVEADWQRAQTVIRNLRRRRSWLRCSCNADGPLLAPALLGKTYYLRRLTLRARHAAECPFADRHPLTDTRQSAGERIRPNPDDFCRVLQKPGNLERLETRRRVSIGSHPFPRLAIELWRLIELAGLNKLDAYAPTAGPRSLGLELAAVRRAARKIKVGTSVTLHEVLSTYPGDFVEWSPWHGKSLAAIARFKALEQPQAFMVGLALGVDGRTLKTAIGDFGCAADIAFTGAAERHAGPPFLFMLAGEIDPDCGAIRPIRAFAQPVFKASRLMPIEHGDERRLLSALLAFQLSCGSRFPSLQVVVEKPLFDIETPAGRSRPPLLLAISNKRMGVVERFILRLECQPIPPERDELGDIGQRLVVPERCLQAAPQEQAAWFIDSIYGAAGIVRKRTAAKANGETHGAPMP